MHVLSLDMSAIHFTLAKTFTKHTILFNLELCEEKEEEMVEEGKRCLNFMALSPIHVKHCYHIVRMPSHLRFYLNTKKQLDKISP
jgi:hypothetical protein